MKNFVRLIRQGGSSYDYTPIHEPLVAVPGQFKTRIAFAAAHVVRSVEATLDSHERPVLDWDATLAYRDYLWSLGFGVAEAMDTAQRGMGLEWPLALELIQRSAAAAKARNAVVACGAGTDHLPLGKTLTLQEIEDAYRLQCEAIEAAGGRIILMASRALAKVARSPEEYASVYERVLRQVQQPVILHWLGPMFDPALLGYWGTTDIHQAMQHCLEVIRAAEKKVDGIKVSLLDADLEITMRWQLPAGVRMYTGDDFNFDDLILGDEHSHSDALLGIFDAIAPAASLALQALDSGDVPRYRQLLSPTVPLSRHIFTPPTQNYKVGIVFLAYLNGFQSHFRMLGNLQTARSVEHFCELFALADQAGMLRDPALAVQRMNQYLSAAGAA